MKARQLLFLMCTSFVLAACGGDNASTDSSVEITLSIEDIKKVYSQNCSSCHGQILAGGIPGDLDKIGTELPKEEIEKIIRKGQGKMKGGLVKGEEAAALVEWLSNME